MAVVDSDELTRNWSILYKGKNTSMTDIANYAIQIVTNTGELGTIAANNLMWGYRIYSSTYPLENTAPTCA